MSLSTDKMNSNFNSSRCSFLNDNIAMTLDFLQVQRTSRGRRWTNQIRGSAWLREWGVAAVQMMELNGGGGGHGDWPSAAQQNRSQTVMRGIERKETERT